MGFSDYFTSTGSQERSTDNINFLNYPLSKREALHPVICDSKYHTFDELDPSSIAKQICTPVFDPHHNFVYQAQIMVNGYFLTS